ncbi:hypothetical protein [Massilia soli]|uniref:hypothetical protein n=1 Tax=Massilia soli TaxID=2792854 RepID=UPI001CBF0617|nr:hypothetical protein [Massilia soli]
METIAALLIGKPWRSALVAMLFLVLYLWRRSQAADVSRRSHMPLLAALAWASYAVWEWVILLRTPEANIRVDLLLIYPLLAVLSLWGSYRALRA